MDWSEAMVNRLLVLRKQLWTGDLLYIYSSSSKQRSNIKVKCQHLKRRRSRRMGKWLAVQGGLAPIQPSRDTRCEWAFDVKRCFETPSSGSKH